ncbi:MAG: acyltransferase, partial [Prevotella sp.]|nr:acyltransferase [Prevotella sp.]
MVTTANSSTTILGTDLSKRQYGLDIMRAAAIMFVVVGHQLDLLPSSLENIVGFFVLDGVNIFFVLSGFLIGGILIRTINRSFGARDLLVFWVNRWMRTLPPYYIVLTLLLCLYALFNIYLYPAPLSLKDTFKYYFFVQGLAWIMPNFFSESWSLCVEEWFYLITPAFLFFLCFFLKIKPKRSLLIVAASIIAGVTAYRFFRHYTLGLDWNAGKYHFIFFYKQVVTRLDAIMYGILGAYTAYYHAGFWKKCKNIAFLLGVIITLADHCSGSIMQFAGIETP